MTRRLHRPNCILSLVFSNHQPIDTIDSMTPGRMLRKIFGQTEDEEPLLPTLTNTTPVFRLAEALPEFADDLRDSLMEQGECALADSVDDLWVCDRCRCEAEYCATIYTLPEPDDGWTGYRGVSVFPKSGVIYLDTADGRIGCIEALDQPELRKKLVEFLP